MFPSLSLPQRRALGDVGDVYRLPILDAPAALPGGVRFGVLADPQYADADPAGDRYYRHGLDKLAQAIDELNRQPLDFVVTLGDLVDREWSSYAAILPLYRRLRHPHLTVLGNHDAQTLSDHLGSQRPPLGLPKHYCQFGVAGYRFIAIDGNDLSLYCNQGNGDDRARAQRMLAELAARGEIQAQPWNGALGDAQLRWLEQVLRAAAARREVVIVFGHYPLAPENRHNLWNYRAVAALLCRYQVRAYFAGHQHGGGFQRLGHTGFITLRGLVEGATHVPFAVVELQGTTLTLTGFGPQESRQLS